MAGVIVLMAGGLLLKLNLVVSLVFGKGEAADNDPWSAQTPEWLLESPPPLGQGGDLTELTSGTPLLDASEADAEEVTV